MAEHPKRRFTRGVIEMVSSIVLLIGSFLGFGWSTLSWWQPSTKGNSSKDLSSLILYTNDPSAAISANAIFSVVNETHLRAFIGIDSALAIDKRSGFRWALIGRGAMKFSADQSVVSNQFKLCQEDGTAISDETVLVGHYGDLLDLNLEFPDASLGISGEQYRVDLGPVGAPGSKDVTQMGNWNVSWYPTCVDLGSGVDVQNAGQLNAAAADWDVSVSPRQDRDTLALADPAPTHIGRATWSFRNFTSMRADFIDTRLHDLHQLVLFVAGILVGLATGFFIQGLTHLTEKDA